MKAIVLLLLTALAAGAPKNVKEGNLHKIYGVNLEKFLKANPVTLFAIHDKSAHSQQVLDILQKLEPLFREKGFNLAVAKLEDRTGPRWVQSWRAYDKPFLRLYLGNGVFSDLKHQPSFKNIYEWVAGAFAPSDDLVEIDSDAKKAQFKREERAFYMRFPPAKAGKYLAILRALQRVDPQLKFYYTTNRILDAFDKFRPNDIVVGFQRNFDDGLKVMSHDKRVSVDTIQRFFDIYRTPDVQEASRELLEEILNKKRKSIVLFEREPSGERMAAFKNAAFKNKERFLFVHADLTTADGQQLAQIVGLDDEEAPAVRIVHHPLNEFRVAEINELGAESMARQIEQFLTSYASNQQEPAAPEAPAQAGADSPEPPISTDL